MNTLLQKYLQKLIKRKLVNPSNVILIGKDDKLYTAGTTSEKSLSTIIRLFDLLKVNTLLYAEPAGAWLSCIKETLKNSSSAEVLPQDCETRTFFHHFPVVDRFNPQKLAEALSETKAVIIKNPLAILSKSTVSPEQAFVAFSSACFSLFVKALYDILKKCQIEGPLKGQALQEFLKLWQQIPDIPLPELPELQWPHTVTEAKELLIQIGKTMVSTSLVDSYFGNLSLLINNTILITQTAASLDELEDAIEEVPFKGGSTVALIASSEMPTHKRIYEQTDHKVILHGHPKFSVIMSMLCEQPCEIKGLCHIKCPRERYLCGAKVVPGEIGTGRFGIVNTVPGALTNNDAVVVISHGVFTADNKNATEALKRMVEIEQCAKVRYYKIVTGRELEEYKSCSCTN